MDIHKIESEIAWETEEIRRDEQGLNRAKEVVRTLEPKIRTHKLRLE